MVGQRKWLKLPELGRPRTVEHYISCARKLDAARLRELAEAEGFTVSLEKPTRLRWVVTMSHVADPTPSYQRRMKLKWEAKAAEIYRGNYDGWGTEWGNEDPLGWQPAPKSPPLIKRLWNRALARLGPWRDA